MTKKEDDKNESYDIIIIGAGPRGNPDYSGRYQMKTLILGKLPGGTANEAFEIWNFPSYEKISGVELMQKTIAQVKNLGVEMKNEDVKEIKKKDLFEVITDKKTYLCKKIIFATGLERRKINLPGEEKFAGKGVAYCSTCDAGFYKDKIVGVIGGGDSAMAAAALLSRYAKKVYILYRKEKFMRAEPTWVKEIENTKNIESIFNAIPTAFLGKDKLEEIEYTQNDKKQKLKVDGVFIEIGSTPGTKIAENVGVKTEKGFIVVDKDRKTNVKGILAVGDVTNNSLKQIITACGDGATAAYSAYTEIIKDKSGN